ncbi:MAG: P-loop NTPase [Anaerolineaceae bacterium]|nr:P-loop NTPase [Anaerolineaceae bacterium]
MPNDQKTLAGKRIGIFGKGGSGKSTLTVLLSKALSERGYKVCVLDADSTNVGLSQVLGYDQPPDPLLEYFGGMVFSGGLVTCPVDDPTPLANAEVEIEGLPEKYYQQNKEGITLLTAGKIGNFGPGAGCDGPIAKIARDLKIHSQGEQPVTLVDFKAGFEDSARGVVTSLDWVIVVIDPTTAAVEMAVNMRDMVEQIKADVLPATSHLKTEEMVFWANKVFTEATIKNVFYILNQVHDTVVEKYLRDKLDQHAIKPIGVIYRDDAISTSWLKGLPIEESQANEEIKTVIDRLEQVDKEEKLQLSTI